MKPTITINGRAVGNGAPVYIVAELSGNHHQDFGLAVRMIEEAKRAGVDAVKLQTYTPDTITFAGRGEPFRIGGGTEWDGMTLHELYKGSFTPWDWQPKLMRIANDAGLALFSSPFDPTAIDFLDAMGVPCFKIASFEIVDIPLLRHVAAKGKPVLISTGMATLGEIEEAVSTLRQSGCPEIALLKCSSAYPAPVEEMNLRTVPHLAEAFGTPVGLSDHSPGIEVPIAAVALGACVIEKHFTLTRSDGGPESSFALDPPELGAMVAAVRVAERALGSVHYGLTEKETSSRIFRRSLFVVQDIRAGEQFSTENVRSIRPGHGLHPRELGRVVGRHAARDISSGTPLSWELVR
ncbi:MAG: pseudaminic acid synthase [Armatimonadetes bacterium]|nr:pseudaminic acid synthase [Armatimonadota bacterium]